MSAAPAPLVWNPTHAPPAFHPAAVLPLLASVRKPAAVVRDPQTGALGLGLDGQLGFGGPGAAGWPVLGQLPALYPEWLGNRSFGEVHGARFAYVQGF